MDEPLAGVTVMVSGTTNGGMTDIDGKVHPSSTLLDYRADIHICRLQDPENKSSARNRQSAGSNAGRRRDARRNSRDRLRHTKESQCDRRCRKHRRKANSKTVCHIRLPTCSRALWPVSTSPPHHPCLASRLKSMCAVPPQSTKPIPRAHRTEPRETSHASTPTT